MKKSLIPLLAIGVVGVVYYLHEKNKANAHVISTQLPAIAPTLTPVPAPVAPNPFLGGNPFISMNNTRVF